MRFYPVLSILLLFLIFQFNIDLYGQNNRCPHLKNLINNIDILNNMLDRLDGKAIGVEGDKNLRLITEALLEESKTITKLKPNALKLKQAYKNKDLRSFQFYLDECSITLKDHLKTNCK